MFKKFGVFTLVVLLLVSIMVVPGTVRAQEEEAYCAWLYGLQTTDYVGAVTYQITGDITRSLTIGGSSTFTAAALDSWIDSQVKVIALKTMVVDGTKIGYADFEFVYNFYAGGNFYWLAP